MKKLLVIGPGPTAAHTTDVLAAQALAAARDAGLELVVLTSAPATLLADPQRADRTYLEPLTLDSLRRVLAQEQPDAVLTTFGGRALVSGLSDAERSTLRWLDAGAERPATAAPALTVVLLAGEAPTLLGTVEHLDALGQGLLVAPAQGGDPKALETAGWRAVEAARALKLSGLVEVGVDRALSVVGVHAGAGAVTQLLAQALRRPLGELLIAHALGRPLPPQGAAPAQVLVADARTSLARAGATVVDALRGLVGPPPRGLALVASPLTGDGDWSVAHLAAEARALGLSPVVFSQRFDSAAAAEAPLVLGAPPEGADRLDVASLGGATAAALCDSPDRFAEVARAAGLQLPEGASPGQSVGALAERLGWPVVMRFASGEVEFCWNSADAERARALKGPVLRMERFLAQAVETDVVVLRDAQGATVVAAVAEHVEPAGVTGQDAGCLCPPHTLSPELVERVKDAASRLAVALQVQGLLHVRCASQGKEVFILGAWARPTWLTPFLSRATGLDLPALALRAVLGKPLGLPAHAAAHPPAAREAVVDASSGDVLLGLEARSRAEVMTLGKSAAQAFGRSQRAAGLDLERRGHALLALAESDHPSSVDLVRRLKGLGFEVVVDAATQEYLASKRHVAATSEGREVALLRDGAVGFFVNTVGRGDEPRHALARLEAASRGVPWFTSVEAARLAVSALEAPPLETLLPLQTVAPVTPVA